MINKKNKNNINELIDKLIRKCNNFGKPIFINIDFSGDFEKEPILKCKELMNNIIEGFDGYILTIKSFWVNKNFDTEFVESLNEMNNNFILQAEESYDIKFTNPEAKLKNLK